MRITYLLCGALLSMTASAWAAGINPPAPGEQIIYKTIQSGNDYRTWYSQITGNAYTELGDEIKVDGTARYVTNIAVGTQTFKNAQTNEYTPAYLQLSIYANDGSPDTSGDPFVDAAPHGTTRPGTLLGRSIVPGISYPQGGTGRDDANINDFVINFPFSKVLVPGTFTIGLINLDSNMNPDITFGVNTSVPHPFEQPGSFRFGLWHSNGQVGSLAAPASGGPFYYGTNYNLNEIGTSRTGPNNNRFTDNGQWQWLEYSGNWESDRDGNRAVDAAVNAAFTPIYGDMDGNGVLDNFDIQPFELALADPDAYAAQYPYLTDRAVRGDINHENGFDNFDIQPFESLLTGGAVSAGAAAVPEPGSLCLILSGAIAVAMFVRRRRT